MAKINGIEKLSYVELINLQKRIEEAIAEKRAADAQTTKEQLRQMARGPASISRNCSASADHQEARASPNIAIRRTVRKLGRVAGASQTGSWMP